MGNSILFFKSNYKNLNKRFSGSNPRATIALPDFSGCLP